MRWSNYTQGIKDLMESIESQIDNAFKDYVPTQDRGYAYWNAIIDLQTIFVV
jgi:hypothetical protein